VKNFVRVLKTLAIILLWIVAGFLIASGCSYSSSAGPFNFDFSAIISLIGLALLIFALILTDRSGKIEITLIMLFCIILFGFGQYVMYHSKQRIELQSIDPEGADLLSPDGLGLAIYYLSSIVLFFGCIVRISGPLSKK